MAILQAYQADVLKEMDEGTGLTPEAVKELRRATDLALRATKHTARAVGRSIAASVAAERHLWLNLTEIREKEKVFLMDAPISQSGLFGEAVSAVVDKFRSAKTQSAALKQFMPRRAREQSLPRKEPPSGGALPPVRFGEPVAGLLPANNHASGLTWSGPTSLPLRLIRVVPDLRVGMRRDVSPLRGEARLRKRFCPPPNTLSSLKSVTATLRGLVCRSSSPSFLLGLAVGGRVRLSPFAARPFAAGEPHVRRHSGFSPAVYGTRAGHPSAQHFSPSSRARTPRAFLHGGGCRCFQAFSTPHLRYVFPYTTLWFLCRTSFTNGSVYPGYRCGFYAQFEPVTLFSLGKIPPASTGFTWQ